MSRRFATGSAAIGETSDRSFLSEIERGYFQGFQAERRCDEFLAGRLAARRALGELGVAVEGLAIVREDDGAPRVTGADRTVALSISHSHVRAIALVAEGELPIGIDLTEWTDAPRIRKVAMRAFPREIERDLVLADDISAVRGWALKEAVAKTLRMGLLEQGGFLRIEIVSLEPPRVRVKDDERVLVLTIVDEEDGVRATGAVGPRVVTSR